MILEVSSRVIEEDGRPVGDPGHLPRHHRTQAGRERAAPALRAEPAPVAARQPDGSAQPRELPRAGRARDRRATTADGTELAGAAARPRSLQGDQRHARSPLRRPAADRARTAARVRPAPAATRSRVSAATSSASWCRSPRALDVELERTLERIARRARAAVPGRRPPALRRGEHRRRALPGARPRRRSAPAARRRRDVPREGLRNAARDLHGGARSPRHGQSHAALGASPGDPGRRARAALPAEARRARRDSSPVSRHSSAGSIRRAGSFRPAISCLPPRRRGSSSRSRATSSTRPSAR